MTKNELRNIAYFDLAVGIITHIENELGLDEKFIISEKDTILPTLSEAKL